ncbi:MAG: signal peptidase I [Rhodococcus sp.]|uniref:signal peptidase I n=1 Tax=Nocardiaceae TaxID=85025 RepID=UPI00050C0809|nr:MULTISPECIES: signal peptidase I [Rhodococcus]AMY55977.1 Signal peptidase I [Rhodococcus fascians D188]KQU31652.1 S26 family signal peptidase [Rhodococcus sp. Leaf233]MBY4227378.1 signal peptidase I [Rhodococcus fascians]MBY4380399.1 signal peptidase I [Rhodococcus fascians]MBY4395134.1 signal peptidase I [Rhodococcus fascians]
MTQSPQDPTPQGSTNEPDDESPRNKRADRKQRSFWRELPILILVALVLSFLLQTFVARVYLIPSESMEPTLHGCAGCTGDRIVVEKIGYRFGDPKPGDIVVFRGPDSWNDEFVSQRSDNSVIRGAQEVGSLIGVVAPDENDLVKRVIATGGQTVECCDAQGRVLVDGKPLDEPYIQMDFPFVPDTMTCDTELKSGRCFDPVTVPEGNIWVMGDNRSNSRDSRYHVTDEFTGTVPLDNVIGKAVAIALPPSRTGLLDSPDIQGR